MTTTSFSPGDLVEQLRTTWSSIEDVCAGLDHDQWRAATGCPGWNVRDQVAHIIGTESMLAGRPTPDHDGDYPDHAKNDIGKFNEHWVGALADLDDGVLLDHFRALTAERLTALDGLSDEEWEAEGPTPVGTAPYRRFIEIRVFDCWAHEQDIRNAVGQPGHASGPAVTRSVDEVVGALGFLMGKKAKLPDGTAVRFVVGDRSVDVVVDGRAKVVDAPAGAPQATVTTDPVTFIRLACGRMSGADALAAGSVAFAGDEELAARITGSLAFTM